MLHFLLKFIIGGISFLMFCLNTILWCCILIPLSFIKLIIPHKGLKNQFSRLLILVATTWIEGNSFIFLMTQNIKWDVQGLEKLSLQESYFVISNHRSWVDIFVLQHIFKRKIPFLKFFLKKELIWVPLLGTAWWALDFPFLKRYSRQFLKKHPELKGKDIETTRKHCKRFRDNPVSIMNFLEGTRFDLDKHKKQNSPYRHLLMPKAGGASLVFSNMGDCLSKVLDVSIVYPENKTRLNFLQLFMGDMPAISVRLKVLPIPKNVVGMNYEEDKEFRKRIQEWVNQIWQEKDSQIETIMKNYKTEK